MDKLDKNLLKELILDSRIPSTQLAKKLKISREVASYRINKLKREGVIIDFVTEINLEKLGYIGAAVFVSVKERRQEAFKQFLKNTSFVSWVAELSGVWNFGYSIIGKNNKELDDKFLQIYTEFKEDIIDHRFTLHKKSTFFYEKYFEGTPRNIKKIEVQIDKLDKKDKMLLKELSKNSRTDAVKLAQVISLTTPAVIKRIKKLKLGGYIEKYSIFVDISKLELFQYSIFLINKNVEEKEKLIGYLTQHPDVSFIAEYVGDPFIELGVFVKDPYELREKIQKIEQRFPSNRIIEVSLFQKEFVSIGPPACVFE